jgi:hypothetical protein
VRFVHELEELVDNRFKELPMRLKESRVLSDNVHNIRSADSLVVLSAFHLSQTEKVLDHRDQETLFGLLIYASVHFSVQQQKKTNS